MGQWADYLQGDLITIRLYENPASGYPWNFNTSYRLKVINEYFISADSSDSVTNAGGWRHITFLPEMPGNESLTATYKRPWEPKTGRGRGYSISFIIR